MMENKLIEDELEFDFSYAVSAKKFDDANHKMGHCMKAVDFTVEWQDEFWLVEVKDPSASKIPSKHKKTRKKEFIEKMRDETLFSGELGPKCKDSFLYLRLSKALPVKKIKFFVLIAINSLDPVLLAHSTDRLKSSTCFAGPGNSPWPEDYLDGVAVFNETTWNQKLGHCPVRRIPSTP